MATSRLKRKVEQRAEDGSAQAPGGFGNLLESFVSLGTPLPSLASKADVGEFKPIWEQEVVDEKGRRRLHGAFTGGFSAGYFNTVGSKEGWTPTTFKSSRAVRGAQGGTKTTVDLAKDLMDEEDLADLTSARTLQTAAAYAAPGVASYDPLLGNYDPSLSAVPSTTPAATALLASLIQPASTRIGAKLMRRMGWREGQGVGPRVTLDQRRKQAKDLGLKLEEEREDADEAAKHYYAPLDRPLAMLEEVGVATDRGWGLGYTPGPSIASSQRQASGSAATALVSLESDDVYAGASALPSGDVKSWGVVEVDEEHEEHYVSGSRTGARLQAKVRGAAMCATTSGSMTHEYPQRHTTSTPSQSFYDGSRVLAGFSVHRNVFTGPSTFQLPPAPPRGWQPDPKRIYADYAASQDKGKGRQLDAEQRGALLGEKLPPPLPKSVFDYMSAKDKERLALIPKLPSHDVPSATTSPSQQPDIVVPLVIPPLDGPTALAALKGFQPFSASSISPDPARQARYTLYLQLQAHLLPPSAATLPFGPRKLPSGATQTIAELNRELDDYARAARVFKPVTGMLAGRFTSGGSGTTLQVAPVAPGLYQPPPKASTTVTDGGGGAVEQERPEMLTPAQNAARVGMFGPLTRSAESFRPARLVCKRFGVRVPYEEGEEEEAEAGGAWKEATRSGYDGNRGPTQEVLGKASMEALMQSQGFRRLQPAIEQFDGSGAAAMVPVPAANDHKPPGAPDVPSTRARAPDAPTLATVGLGDDEAQGAETLTEKRAPRDIFAAIFADSDDESDDDDAEDDLQGSKAVQITPTTIQPTTAPSTTALRPDLAPLPPSDIDLPEPIGEPLETSLSSTTISSYRPSFVSTAVRTSKPDGETKKKSKRKAKVALSFDVEDGEELMATTHVKKKMKRTVEEAPKVELEDEWTEAQSTVHPSLLGGKRARASDLYD